MSGEEQAQQKAWDKSQLVAKLKEQGLDVAEEAVGKLFETVMDWTEHGLTNDDEDWNDMLVMGIPAAKKFVLPLIDKIDGEEG